MKKLFAILIGFVMLPLLLAGCIQTTQTSTENNTPTQSGELSPVNVSEELSAFDFEKRTVTLNNGIEMPIVGLGTFTLTPEQASDSVYYALTYGYKLVDTANAYNNEEGVGEGIVKSGVPREEIFVTTKLWPSSYEDIAKAIDDTLERLRLEYIDLLLLHQPYGNYITGYQGMEAAVTAGKVRSIGLSNLKIGNSKNRNESKMYVIWKK